MTDKTYCKYYLAWYKVS